MHITLAQSLPGDRLKFIHYGQTKPDFRQKLLALGLVIGCEVKVVKIAPLSCPIEIELLGINLALRKNETAHLQWEKL